MEKLLLSEIVTAVQGSFGYPGDIEVTSISTDTRTIEKGSVFVALKGKNFDGHDYAKKAMELGAVAVVTERAIDDAKCIIVDSTQTALLDIAGYYRDKFDIKLVGITGSVGKTTTKEFVSLVMSKKFKTLKTQKNFNNEIGLPMTLFNLSNEHEAAVIEMGMSNSGEISRLSLTAKPNICVITNIGFSHIENLGSQENILKAKLEILDGADETAPLIVSKDDKLLKDVQVRESRKLIFYSICDSSADVYATDIKTVGDRIEFNINCDGLVHKAVINCLGEHNVKNALAAFCVGREYNIDPRVMVQAIGEFAPDGIRQNITDINGVKIIADCYNSSPDSAKSAIRTLSQVENKGKKIAVLGDMLELGKMSKELHRSVGEAVCENGIDILLCIGKFSEFYIKGAVKKGFNEKNTKIFTLKSELAEYLKNIMAKGDTVLFKASRGMKFEEIIEMIK